MSSEEQYTTSAGTTTTRTVPWPGRDALEEARQRYWQAIQDEGARRLVEHESHAEPVKHCIECDFYGYDKRFRCSAYAGWRSSYVGLFFRPIFASASFTPLNLGLGAQLDLDYGDVSLGIFIGPLSLRLGRA